MTPEVESVLKQSLATIRPFSSTVKQVLKELSKEPVDMGAVARIMTLDPILGTVVLRLANSAFYGFPRQIEQVREGCVLLGLHTLRQLMLSLSLIRAFPDTPGQGFDRRALWTHSIAVGAAARWLAVEVDLDPDRAFTAGLLHDIGQFILDQAFPGRYGQVLADQVRTGADLVEAEVRVFGVSHTEAGSFALSQWQLPEVYARVAEGHYPCTGPIEDRLVALVHLADVLVKGLQISPEHDRRLIELRPGALEVLDLELAQIEPNLEQIDQVARKTVELLLVA